jgi:uncharacterized protein (TIGR00251 family)
MSASPRLRVKEAADGILIDLRVTPRASRTSIEGVREGRLVVRVTAAPVDDAANDAVVRAIADAFDVPKSRVAISAGATGRNKTVAITGIRPERAAAAIEALTR